MKRLLSPAMFAVVVICFLLPFISISCDASALQDPFGGTESPIAGPTPIPGFPGGGGEVELTKATGFDIVFGTSAEVEGLGGLGALGGQTTEQGSWADLDGRIWVILALVAAVAGLGLSLLRGGIGALGAVVMGIAVAATLFIFRLVASPNLDAAQAGPGADAVSLNFKIGWWLALIFGALAAGTGVWLAMRGDEPPVAGELGAPGEPPPPAGEPPPPPG